MDIQNILQLKFPDASFVRDIVLQDDGDGVYIAKWNRVEPKPSKGELDQWAIELDFAYQEKLVVEQRKLAYPKIEDQLDMIYIDKLNNTNIWVDTISAIKTEYPKPSETSIVK